MEGVIVQHALELTSKERLFGVCKLIKALEFMKIMIAKLKDYFDFVIFGTFIP